MRTITHSDLRNGSARILRDAEAGETMLVTNHGKPVAVIGPTTNAPTDTPRLLQPATVIGFKDLPRYKRATTTQAIIDELRGDH